MVHADDQFHALHGFILLTNAPRCKSCQRGRSHQRSGQRRASSTVRPWKRSWSGGRLLLESTWDVHPRPPSLVRTDAVINFNWDGAAPDPSISSTIIPSNGPVVCSPYSETYTFYTLSDAGARLWINDQLLIDDWTNPPPTLSSASIPMLAQQIYNIRMGLLLPKHGAILWRSALEEFPPRRLALFPKPSFIPSPTRRRSWS